MFNVDARGMSCPQLVLMVKKAVKKITERGYYLFVETSASQVKF